MRVRPAINKRVLSRALLLVAAVLVTVYVLYPFLWMVTYSIRPKTEMFESPPRFIPRQPVLDNYRGIFATGRFGIFFRNSVIVTLCTTLAVVVVASLAGYAISRFRFRGRRVFTFAVLSSQLFPVYVIIIPLFVVFNALKLYDTLVGLMVVYVAVMQPFSIFLMLGFYSEIPREMEESAYIDGASRVQTLTRIVLPNMLNGITAVAIFVTISTWQEFLLALTLTLKQSNRTLPVGLMYFFSEHTTDYAGIMAASVLTTIPTMLVFLFLQKYFVRGMISGTVKG